MANATLTACKTGSKHACLCTKVANLPGHFPPKHICFYDTYSDMFTTDFGVITDFGGYFTGFRPFWRRITRKRVWWECQGKVRSKGDIPMCQKPCFQPWKMMAVMCCARRSTKCCIYAYRYSQAHSRKWHILKTNFWTFVKCYSYSKTY